MSDETDLVSHRLGELSRQLEALWLKLDARFLADDMAKTEMAVRVAILEQRVRLYSQVLSAVALAVLGVVANAVRIGFQ